MSEPRRLARTAQQQTISIRGLAYRLHCWGAPDGDPLLLLHGWGDTGASFQFLVDALGDRRVVAPDWRGFGDTEWSAGGYWFPDYLADLDAILDHLSPDGPACIVGQSMGGNVAGLYAGARPERVKALVLVEGFGLRASDPRDAPLRYRQWLEEQLEPRAFRRYASIEDFANRLRARSPRLSPDRSRFVAEAWSRADGEGGRVLKADPAHKRVNPVLYRRAEAEACWRAVRTPVLLVAGEESPFAGLLDEMWLKRSDSGIFPDARRETIPESGHMVHHEQPERLAELIERFLRIVG
ncbi:MAG: alpha/beta fold hydrolase [Gammaproteobacteria bacterium]